MTLNKHQGVRAALCWKSEIARLAKAHNNANVLSMPARFISYAMATRILRTWLETEFEGGRHLRRIEKIPVSR
jgi:ribose 5-phosphate isomerase B